MSDERVFSLRNRWFAASVGGTVGLAVVAILIGFVWLPSEHPDYTANGLWAAICSAAGAPSSWYNGGDTVTGTAPSEVVVLPPPGRGIVDVSSSGRGASLATAHCSMCHGVQGTVRVTAPALAGQYADAIYKELRDYQSGARQNAIMRPIIANLSDGDLHDLAAYYSGQPRVEPVPVQGDIDPSAHVLVMQGAPLRNIAPCAACHGEKDRKGAAPWIGGQAVPYLASQLQQFASGERHNDINGQMRNVARQLTPQEIDALAKYYAAQP